MHSLYFPWIRILFFILILSGSVYSVHFLDPTPPNLDLQPEDFQEYSKLRTTYNSNTEYTVNGTNRNFGNLVGCEPFFLPLDFYSAENFKTALEPVLKKAEENKALDRKTVVIFPEHVGTGLILLGEKKPAFYSKSIEDVRKYLAEQHNEDGISKEIDLKYIIYKKKDRIALAYNKTFSELATQYSVNIIAGSILLPNPRIEKGVLVAGEGDIYNVSVTYLANGKAIEPLIKKVHLETWEEEVAVPGNPNQDFIVSVPSWKVGLAIGRDSFYETIPKAIGGKKIDGLVSPASSFRKLVYDLGEDITSLQDPDIWIRYSIGKLLPETKAKVSIQVFWNGEGWDLEPDVESYSFQEIQGLQRSGRKKSAKVLNLYF
jgi:predicted amidohydrolase